MLLRQFCFVPVSFQLCGINKLPYSAAAFPARRSRREQTQRDTAGHSSPRPSLRLPGARRSGAAPPPPPPARPLLARSTPPPRGLTAPGGWRWPLPGDAIGLSRGPGFSWVQGKSALPRHPQISLTVPSGLSQPGGAARRAGRDPAQKRRFAGAPPPPPGGPPGLQLPACLWASGTVFLFPRQPPLGGAGAARVRRVRRRSAEWVVAPVAGPRPRCFSRPQVGRARRAAAPRRALPGVEGGKEQGRREWVVLCSCCPR